MSIKPHGAVLLLLALVACEAPPRTDGAAGPAEEASTGTPAPAPAPVSNWRLASNGEGVSLELAGSGASVARFACLHSGRVFQAQGFGLNPIGSEERLTVGAGNEAHALVANPGATATGVLGAGSISPALLDAIEAGGPLSISYGAQTLGPLESLSPADQAAFVSGCRSILAG